MSTSWTSSGAARQTLVVLVLTVVGFLRGSSMVVYSGAERIVVTEAHPAESHSAEPADSTQKAMA